MSDRKRNKVRETMEAFNQLSFAKASKRTTLAKDFTWFTNTCAHAGAVSAISQALETLPKRSPVQTMQTFSGMRRAETGCIAEPPICTRRIPSADWVRNQSNGIVWRSPPAMLAIG